MDDYFLETSDGALSYLRKESLDIFNRLHSIEEDVLFVIQVHEAYPDTPILPNLRCGAWYTNPEFSTHIPAYFKSTDGHNNNWSFNLRRSNLHLLPVIIERNGLILVDSTRSGKRIPDALSKTVPIWCAVINRAILILHPDLERREGYEEWDVALYTPPSTVSKQEHHQIELRLDGWAQELAASSFSLPMLPNPLRPVWITPATSTFPRLPSEGDALADFLPVICVSASKQINQGVEGRSNGFSYIQGSGDDHELWGMGLSPEIFWKHHRELLDANRIQLPSLVDQCVSSSTISSAVNFGASFSSIVKVKGRLLVGSLSELPDLPYRIGAQENEVYLVLIPAMFPYPSHTDPSLYIPIVPGKKGQSHFLATVLPSSAAFIGKHLNAGRNVCIVCESGKDVSVGVAVAALQLFFKDDGSLSMSNFNSKQTPDNHTNKDIDKRSIRTRLEWIIASRPQANPSRTILKRVNEFLLTSSSFRPASTL